MADREDIQKACEWNRIFEYINYQILPDIQIRLCPLVIEQFAIEHGT